MVNHNNRNNKGKKQPPKATLDLKAKDITEKDSQTSKTSSTPKVSLSTSKASASNQTGTKADTQKTASASKGTVPPTSAKSAATAKDTGSKAGAKASPAPKGAPTKSASKQKSGGGFLSNLVSAVVGGIVALFGISYAGGPDSLMKMTGMPASSNSELSSLKQEIAALKQGDGKTDIAALMQKVTALEKNQKQSSGTTSSAQNEKIAQLETTLKSLTNAASDGGKSAVASAAIVQKQLEEAGVTGFKNQVLDLRKQNTAVQNEQAKLHESMANIAEEQAKLHSNIAKMREDTAKLKNSAAKLTSEVAQGPDLTSAMAPLLAKIAAFENQISAVQTENKNAKSEGRNIALAIELSNLKRVLSKGQPYHMELDRIKPHIPSGMDISVLERYAAQGLPNIAQLNKSLNQQMDLIMASEIEAQDTSTLSWQDKLLAKAKSAIKMRPTGYVEGDSTDAVLARIEYKLKQKNDLSGALEEAKALPAKPADVAKKWIQTASDKLTGDKLLQQIESKLMTGLRGSTSP